jgi:hypothetical protein
MGFNSGFKGLKYNFIAEENVGRDIGVLFYPVDPDLWDTIYRT